MKKINLNIAIPAIIIIAILGFMSWSMYQNLVVLPRTELSYKILQDYAKEENYKTCVSDIESQYNTNWENECSSLLMGKNCRLAGYTATRLNDIMAEGKKNCITMYK